MKRWINSLVVAMAMVVGLAAATAFAQEYAGSPYSLGPVYLGMWTPLGQDPAFPEAPELAYGVRMLSPSGPRTDLWVFVSAAGEVPAYVAGFPGSMLSSVPR